MGGLRSGDPRRIRLHGATTRKQIERIGADIGLPIGVLGNRTGNKAVTNAVEYDLVVVNADHLDPLVAQIAERGRGDDRGDIRSSDDAADLVLLSGQQGVDLLVPPLLVVGVTDSLKKRDRTLGL